MPLLRENILVRRVCLNYYLLEGKTHFLCVSTITLSTGFPAIGQVVVHTIKGAWVHVFVVALITDGDGMGWGGMGGEETGCLKVVL